MALPNSLRRRHRISSLFHWFRLLAFLLVPADALGELAVFQQGVSDASGPNPGFHTEDATIKMLMLNGVPTTSSEQANWGGEIYTEAGSNLGGKSRILLRFDLASLSGRVEHIISARLVVRLRRYISGGNEIDMNHIDFRLYPIAESNADWREGNGLGEVLPAACWRGRQGELVPWMGEAGCGNVHIDCLPQAAEAATSPSMFVAGSEWALPFGNLALLQDWVEHPNANGGFLLRAEVFENAPAESGILLQFYSDDAANPDFRPRLEIEYDPSGEAAVKSSADGEWLALP